MGLRIGNKVRFLNEKGEGVITRFSNKTTAIVELEDGMEIPYPVNQLVVVDKELVFEKEKEQISEGIGEEHRDAVFFVMEPDHELPLLQDKFSFYLFNSSSFHALFSYSVKDGQMFQTLKTGEIGPFQKLLLKQISKRQLDEFSFHKIDLLYFKRTHYTPQVPTSEVVHISEKVIAHQGFIPNSHFKLPVIAFTLKDEFFNDRVLKQKLTDYDIERLKTIKEKSPDLRQSKPNDYLRSLMEKEVDLHIENLVDSKKGMTNYDMLQTQIRHFQKELEQAIEKNFYKIVFIHGVGNGRLKQEILTILKGYPEFKVQDASYKRYGYGATEVILRKD